MQDATSNLPSTRELRWFAPVGFILLLLPAVFSEVPPGTLFNPLQWAFAAWCMWLIFWFLAWQRRALNRVDASTAPFPDLGWGNRLTLLRGLFLAALGGFALQPVSDDSWLPALCYGAAALLDRFDGEVARRTRRCTELGAALDTLYDALGLVVAPVVALLLGKLHVGYLLTSVAYYWFIAGLYWRSLRGLPVHPLAPSALRRTLAGCQMGFVAFALWPPFSGLITQWLGLCFMVPLLLGFLVDWMQVSGRYDPYATRNVARRETMVALSENWLLPALRVATAVALLGLPAFANLPWLATASLACAILTGCLVRVAGIAVMLLLAWQFEAPAMDPHTLFCCAASVALLIFGGGRFSLWRADDPFLYRNPA